MQYENEDLNAALKAQWWEVKVLKDFSEPYGANAKKYNNAYACVIPNGKVFFWVGNKYDCYTIFKTIDEIKPYATCIKKTRNKTNDMISSWNRAMY